MVQNHLRDQENRFVRAWKPLPRPILFEKIEILKILQNFKWLYFSAFWAKIATKWSKIISWIAIVSLHHLLCCKFYIKTTTTKKANTDANLNLHLFLLFEKQQMRQYSFNSCQNDYCWRYSDFGARWNARTCMIIQKSTQTINVEYMYILNHHILMKIEKIHIPVFQYSFLKFMSKWLSLEIFQFWKILARARARAHVYCFTKSKQAFDIE